MLQTPFERGDLIYDENYEINDPVVGNVVFTGPSTCLHKTVLLYIVIPAKAGIQLQALRACGRLELDSESSSE